MILDRACVTMRMDGSTQLRHVASRGIKFQRGFSDGEAIGMIDITLKAFALTALASIVIGAVRWLLRRPTALLAVVMLLGATTLLVR
jgi:hypothetical protein